MSNISEPLTTAKKTRSTERKHSATKSEDLQLVAERLALIQGHLSKMPGFCISGAVVMDGFLLVALKVEGHILSVDGNAWKLDGRNVTTFVSGVTA